MSEITYGKFTVSTGTIVLNNIPASAAKQTIFRFMYGEPYDVHMRKLIKKMADNVHNQMLDSFYCSNN